VNRQPGGRFFLIDKFVSRKVHFLMKTSAILLICFAIFMFISCSPPPEEPVEPAVKEVESIVDQFADLRILRFEVPGFDVLEPRSKELLYYLYQAALSGRDMIYDQNYKHNLRIRRTVEAIVNSYSGDRSTPEFERFMVFAKRFWFSNGIHHHYSKDKFLPEISVEYFAELVNNSPNGAFPLDGEETLDDLIEALEPILFDPDVDAKSVNLDSAADLIADSANNYYEGLTQQQVESYIEEISDPNDSTPISHGLNSKMVLEDGQPTEKVWKIGGMYTEAIERVVFWLEKAQAVAETEIQGEALEKLIEYYKTGDLKLFDEYNIAWVQDTDSRVDVVNGFIETYGDALGYRGAYESVVSIRDLEATERIKAIGDQAQWFEDHSSIMDEHKRPEVTGISAKVITVVVESGDASPSSPVGINLPNSNWIRSNHGSKSVTLGNLQDAYSQAAKASGYLEEFGYSEEEIERNRLWGTLASNLKVDMHEVIGHASGKIEGGVGTPSETLKNYAAALEEARSDLVALYYLMDEKLVEIGVMPSLEVGRTEYDSYIRNGLLWQLRRVRLGDQIEQAHMRNRQVVSKWALEMGEADNVIERKERDGKTFYVINDHVALREIFGKMLREVQRIKSQGDYEAGSKLVEKYGVQVDRELHAEVLERFEKLNIAPYSGFLNPQLVPVMKDGEIVDVELEQFEDFTSQMLFYGREYSFLPTYN
jgi:dipeptidyl-peptidase-3